MTRPAPVRPTKRCLDDLGLAFPTTEQPIETLGNPVIVKAQQIPSEAILQLLEAERVAPQTVRYNVLAREMIPELTARGRHGRTSALHNLAVRAGMLEAAR